MTLTGVWKNRYGSVMDLAHDARTGGVLGIYSSSTGSTGRYYVYGWAAKQPPLPTLGAATCLCIYWRSISGGEPDPSWHWVSGLGGQLSVTDRGEQTLSLMHAMIATDTFPGVAEPGIYLDKLLYSRVDVPSSLQTMPDHLNAIAEDALNGDWACCDEPNVGMTLQVANSKFGITRGTLAIDGNKYEANGFTDTYAASASLKKQSFCLTSHDARCKALTLAGSLDFESGILEVTVFENSGTENENTYLTTTTRSLRFRLSRESN